MSYGMIVISYTTPIISLLKANCLDLLEKLYEKMKVQNKYSILLCTFLFVIGVGVKSLSFVYQKSQFTT